MIMCTEIILQIILVLLNKRNSKQMILFSFSHSQHQN